MSGRFERVIRRRSGRFGRFEVGLGRFDRFEVGLESSGRSDPFEVVLEGLGGSLITFSEVLEDLWFD